MRSILVAPLLGFLFIGPCCAIECFHFRVEFVNNTDSLLCCEGAPGQYGQFSDRCLNRIEPQGTTVWRPECESGGDYSTVRLTVGARGREIYDRTATCGEWKASGGTFIIEQDGDEFVVADSLPENTPSP